MRQTGTITNCYEAANLWVRTTAPDQSPQFPDAIGRKIQILQGGVWDGEWVIHSQFNATIFRLEGTPDGRPSTVGGRWALLEKVSLPWKESFDPRIDSSGGGGPMIVADANRVSSRLIEWRPTSNADEIAAIETMFASGKGAVVPFEFFVPGESVASRVVFEDPSLVRTALSSQFSRHSIRVRDVTRRGFDTPPLVPVDPEE